jgi:hypothetical protein
VPGIVGDPVELILPDADLPRLASATLTLPYDPADPRVGDPGDLRIFYLDEAQGRWRPADGPQTVDPAAGTVSVELEHFSTYALFDTDRWSRYWASLDNPCVGRRPRDGGTDLVLLDLSLVLDSSGSMGTHDPDGLRKDAARAFVDGLLDDDRAAVVDFDDDAYVVQGLTSDKAALRDAIRSIDDAGGSNIAEGVRVGTDLLLDNGDPDRDRVAVLLTDGRGHYDPDLTDRARDVGIVIYTIGLGDNVDDDLLRSIAEGTGGDYLHVDEPTDLPDAFDRVAQVAGSDPSAKRDTDGDGLNDCVELRGWHDGYGNHFTSNPAETDTDGDGLADADEAGEPIPGTATTGTGLRSLLRAAPEDPPTRTAPGDPTRRDRDGDGLTDANEYDMATPALNWDADHDGLLDGTEIDLGTDPQNRDTDRDGFTDGYERHHPGKGLHPAIPDKRVSKWTYIKDFSVGLILGELKRVDSLSWLGGCLLAGSSSIIPVAGWVTGTFADLRDLLGDLLHGDWVGAGLDIAGLVPYPGDAVKIVGKVVRFVLHNPHLQDGALAMVAGSKHVAKTIRIKAITAATAAQSAVLKHHGFTDDALLTLGKGSQNFDELAAAVSGPLSRQWTGSAAGVMKTWRDGERWLQAALGATRRGFDYQVYSQLPKGLRYLGEVFSGGRYSDLIVGRVAHEVKVGRVRLTPFVRMQLAKDKWLLSHPERSGLRGVHWHFMISGRSGTVGPSRKMLERLEQLEIPYTIHVA